MLSTFGHCVVDTEIYAWYGASIGLVSSDAFLVSFTHSVNIHSASDRDRIKESVCEFFSSTFAIHSSTHFLLKHAPPTVMFV